MIFINFLRNDPRTTLPCAKHAHKRSSLDVSHFGQRQRWSRLRVGDDGEAGEGEEGEEEI